MKKTILFLAVCLGLGSQMVEAQQPFSGGSGILGDPYLISSKEDLEELADSVRYGVMQGIDNWSNSKYFSLTQSIADTVRRPVGETFLLNNYYFEGHFEGNDFKITLGITASSGGVGTRIALFSWARGGFTVQNLIVDGYVFGTGGICAAGIVGNINPDIFDTRINIVKNCINKANITGALLVGGIGSTARLTVIENCINIGTIKAISSYSDVGGIVAEAIGSDGVTISNCKNIGSIINTITIQTNVSFCFGGIVGYARNTTINNCINFGYVKSNYTGTTGGVGGILGATSSGTNITNSINVGVIETNEIKGCILGNLRTPISLINNWWDKQMCPNDEYGEP